MGVNIDPMELWRPDLFATSGSSSKDLGGSSSSIDLGGNSSSIDLGGYSNSLDRGGSSWSYAPGSQQYAGFPGFENNLPQILSMLSGSLGNLPSSQNLQAANRQIMGGISQDVLNNLNARGMLNSSVSSDALSKAIAAAAPQMAMQSVQLDAQLPQILAGIASLGKVQTGIDFGQRSGSTDLGGYSTSQDLGGHSSSIDLGGNASSLDLGGWSNSQSQDPGAPYRNMLDFISNF